MFAGKEVRVLLKGQAKESYLELQQRTDKESQMIFKSIEHLTAILKQNPQYGDPIKKDLIPKEFKRQGIQNLYRAELSQFWRVLYTIEGTQVEMLVFILSISDHKTYDKIMKYKKK